jgi:uncharacterized protein
MTRNVSNPVRAPTFDKEADVPILTVEQLGPNMSMTPNGNLLCKNVPAGRVGWLVYGPNEVPVEVNPETGFSRIYRSAEQLFHPKTIGSFMGCAVVDDHPTTGEDVTPTNWKKLSRGFITTNVRQGTGDDADVLLVDLIVSDADLIRSVRAGKREVSLGYDADYEDKGNGEGVQTNIIGNHIALVERGRCGPRCAIGDQSYQPKKEIEMTTRVKLKTTDRAAILLRAHLRKQVRDAEAMAEAQGINMDPTLDEDSPADDLAGSEGGDTHIHIHTNGDPVKEPESRAPSTDDDPMPDAGGDLEARLTAIEQRLDALEEMGSSPADTGAGADPAGMEETDPDATKDGMDLEDMEGGASKTQDSKALATGWTALMSQAEVLVPGFRVPTFDAKAKRATTVDTMCMVRRSVLDRAYATADGKTLVDAVYARPGLNLAKLNCAQTAALFRGAAGAKMLLNNRSATGDSGRMAAPNEPKVYKPLTLAEISAQHAAYWSKA